MMLSKSMEEEKGSGIADGEIIATEVGEGKVTAIFEVEDTPLCYT